MNRHNRFKITEIIPMRQLQKMCYLDYQSFQMEKKEKILINAQRSQNWISKQGKLQPIIRTQSTCQQSRIQVSRLNLSKCIKTESSSVDQKTRSLFKKRVQALDDEIQRMKGVNQIMACLSVALKESIVQEQKEQEKQFFDQRQQPIGSSMLSSKSISSESESMINETKVDEQVYWMRNKEESQVVLDKKKRRSAVVQKGEVISGTLRDLSRWNQARKVLMMKLLLGKVGQGKNKNEVHKYGDGFIKIFFLFRFSLIELQQRDHYLDKEQKSCLSMFRRIRWRR